MDNDFEKALKDAEDSEGMPPAVITSPGAVGMALDEIDQGGVRGQEQEMLSDQEAQEMFNSLRPWQRTYLAALRIKGNVTLASRAARVSARTVERYRLENEFFSSLCEDALKFNDDIVEGRAYQLGVEGILEPVFQGGICVGQKRVFSERMIEIMLKSRKPNKFDTGKKLNITTSGGFSAPMMEVAQVAELVRNLSPTLAAGVLASRQKTLDGAIEVIQKA
jgi:hypothetical protein